MFRWATDDQVDVVGLDGEVENLQPLVVGNFVENVSHIRCNITDKYRLPGHRYPHYVGLEGGRCGSRGPHPYETLFYRCLNNIV